MYKYGGPFCDVFYHEHTNELKVIDLNKRLAWRINLYSIAFFSAALMAAVDLIGQSHLYSLQRLYQHA